MTTYQEKLNQLKIQASVLPKEIKDNIANLNELIDDLHAKGDEVEALTDPAAITAGEEELDEMEQDIEAIDTAIAVDIETWWANKDKYADRVQAMAKGRESKKALKNGTPPPVAAAQGATAGQRPAPQEAAASAAPQSVEKEENDWAWWVLGGLVAAVTLGTVILKKK
jgi:chromosome segregation ATPase